MKIANDFFFNSDKYDFWEIYNTIKKFYPIGIPRGWGEGNYFEYPGIKELERIVVENIHHEENFKARWTDFDEKIGKESGKEIQGTTYGQAPSFSSSIILERNISGQCIHTKELHFSVSLIGNFFQIYGLDTTRIMEENNEQGYSAVNVVTTSPFKEFKELFEFCEKKINENFPEHRIVPFIIGQSIIRGLQVRYLDDEICSINKALFNHFLSDEYISESTRGDYLYGMESWEK